MPIGAGSGPTPLGVARTILADGDVAGSIVRFEQDGHVEVGYWLERSWWGRGIGRRALALFVAAIPDRPLFAWIAADNVASRRVLEHAGFRVIGADLELSSVRGTSVDQLVLRLDDPVPAVFPGGVAVDGPGRGSPIDAAVALGRAHGLEVDEPRILKDGSNVVVQLAPAPVVVRVATFTARIRHDPRPWLEREATLVQALAEDGAAVMGPSPLVPVGPHEIDGWWMTAWALVEHDPGAVPAPMDALRALDRLHAAIAALAPMPELPLLVPAVDDLDLAIAFARDAGLLSDDRSARLATERDVALADLLAETSDRRPLHGDAFPRNSLVGRRGIVWIDLEDCCSGPAAWDDATLLRRTRDPDVERVLVGRYGRPALDAAIRLRGVQEEVWTILHDARRDGPLAPTTA
jgi:RimJ/RimL family protein N-acetyltransferase